MIICDLLLKVFFPTLCFFLIPPGKKNYRDSLNSDSKREGKGSTGGDFKANQQMDKNQGSLL